MRDVAMTEACKWATVMLALALGCQAAAQDEAGAGGNDTATTAVATFAGGCFWCMEPPFDKLDGVLGTTSGYIGGDVRDPSYEEVSAGNTGHAEAVQVEYDPQVIGYPELLDVYWPNVDPLDAGGQFCDRGDQYRSAIFYHNERQRELAMESKRQLEASGKLSGDIVTAIESATEFWPAEDYHQNYYQEHGLRYKFYRFTCGRDDRLEEVWGDDEDGGWFF